MDNLAKDAKAAIRAGMSYGKWKALQKNPLPKMEPVLHDGWRKCPWCNTPFKPKQNQKYCHWDCQRAAQKERHKSAE